MPHLYKQDNGNLQFFAATTAEEESLARAAGYKLLSELFPTGDPTDKDLDAVAEEDRVRDITKGRKGRK